MDFRDWDPVWETNNHDNSDLCLLEFCRDRTLLRDLLRQIPCVDRQIFKELVGSVPFSLLLGNLRA